MLFGFIWPLLVLLLTSIRQYDDTREQDPDQTVHTLHATVLLSLVGYNALYHAIVCKRHKLIFHISAHRRVCVRFLLQRSTRHADLPQEMS